MRGIEAREIEVGTTTGIVLMERAGEAVVASILGHWAGLAERPRHAVVLCGPGNNGGDGYVVARLLAARGWRVDVQALGDPARLPPDARVNHDRWVASGGKVSPFGAAVDGEADLLVDALFGIGLTRDFVPEHPFPRAARTVAVDVPSGVNADTGRALGAVVPADLTVTFHAAKLGHHLGDGPALCGALVVADIGLPQGDEGVPLVGPPDPAGLRKAGAGHKFGHGHAVVLAGGTGRGGAARLAARAALRVGAGLVTLAPPPEALAENAARLDAVMLRTVADAAALAEMLGDARITALCLGPALGTGPREAGLVGVALGLPVPGLPRDLDQKGGPGSGPGRGRGGCALVLDADALTLLSRHPDLFAALHEGCVLTPHDGEFARLFPDLAEASDRVAALRMAAERAGAVILSKGQATLIAAPDGRVALHSAAYGRAAPWLATAGSGDVLAGIITGLLARGMDPFGAACTGAWLHAECARAFGAGLIAEDLPDLLPAVLRALGV